MRQLVIFALVAIAFFGCEEEEETKYDCTGNTCYESKTGQYSSLSDCESNCQIDLTYDCYGGNCSIAYEGEYTSLSECETACTAIWASTYDCVNYNCVELSDGTGLYQTLGECEDFCNSLPPAYTCNGTDCDLQFQGEHDDYTECMQSCNPAWYTMGHINYNGVSSYSIDAMLIDCESVNGGYSVEARFIEEGNPDNDFIVEFHLASVPANGTVLTLSQPPDLPYGRTAGIEMEGTITFYNNVDGRYRIDFSNTNIIYAASGNLPGSFLQCIP